MTQSHAKPSSATAHDTLLALEDGTLFWGKRAGAQGEAFGEFVFNTGMTGYQEVLTDPSYRGQIVVMTYPEIGIYGTNPQDVESAQIQVAGFVVHRALGQSFNQRATCSLSDYLCQARIVAADGVDTRALTRHIRARGAMRGAISSVDLDPDSLVARVRQSPHMAGRNLVQELSPVSAAIVAPSDRGQHHIVVVDIGVKAGILREVAQTIRGATVSRVAYDMDVETVLALKPDAVLVSNGPGDPAALSSTIRLVRGLLQHRVPIAGICLGHQILALALGGQTYKMQFGHRASNHPVKNLSTGRVLITTQNHGFAVDPTSLGVAWEPLDAAFQPAHTHILERQAGSTKIQRTMAELLPARPLKGNSPLGFGPLEITHLSLNDGTLEGLKLKDSPAFSVQFHPEASPGPHDAKGFFDQFVVLMEAPSAQTRRH